jgi:SHS2 domain-containing protein
MRATSTERPTDSGPAAAASWELFEHGADVGVRGRGETCARAFENAGRALTAAIADLDTIEPRVAVAVHCSAPDAELLLVDWLNALIFEMATRHMLFSRFFVALTDHRLEARVAGDVIDTSRHRVRVEAKGATLTEAAVRRESDGTWVAQCVVDL